MAAEDRQDTVEALPADKLRPECDPGSLPFERSDELEPIADLIGQDRALDAIRFGIGIRQQGYNLFALGARGSGRHSALMSYLGARAPEQPAPDDWVYVNNFQVAHKPKAMRLPPGTAVGLRDAMRALIDDLRGAVPTLFDSDDYRSRRRAIDEAFQESQEGALEALREKAEKQGIGIVRTPMGFALAPMHQGQVIKPEVFRAMPEAERRSMEARIEALQKDLADVLGKLPFAQKERRDQIRQLHTELATTVIGAAFAGIEQRFGDIAAIATFLADAKKDLVENVEIFLAEHQAAAERAFPAAAADVDTDPRYRRYAVNVLVGNGQDGRTGAPLVSEDHPTLANLIGRIEHIPHMGSLVTDFTMIRPGALHRANGGYLLLDARKVLSEPFAWEALKRALRSACVSIVSPGGQLSLISTVSLEPEPIPLDVKVVLVGERMLYYLLTNLDPDFSELFKVQVDFEDEFERNPGNVDLYARLIATIARGQDLRPLDAPAVARVIDEAVRQAGDGERISLRVGPLGDLLREADFWAGDRGRDTITADDVEMAVAERERRADRPRVRALEAIERGIMLIDTQGAVTGQVNGLSVLGLGDYSFGRPARITARVRMGTGRVVDIERETKLGGALHSKGVLILSSFLSAHYATDAPMSLWASLVFEQSYGGVDGDSASCAELYALMSALADVPIRQGLAVTGSVNQFGEVQAIGGVNEKIEGFFDICKARGLTGEQGVLIPASNVVHLMLRRDVAEACAQGRFHVYPVRTVDEGITLLTGVEAGRRGPDGRFPEGSVNALVDARLRAFARARQDFGPAGQRLPEGAAEVPAGGPDGPPDLPPDIPPPDVPGPDDPPPDIPGPDEPVPDDPPTSGAGGGAGVP